MPKADQILKLLPAIYRARDRYSLLSAVVRALAGPVEEADTHLFRVQRAHRLAVTEYPADVVKLASVLALNAFHFEDLLDLPYADVDRVLAMMRQRVRRVARIHLDGLATPWAVLESTAVFVNASIVPATPDAPLVRHLDDERYSHEATVQFDEAVDTPRDRLVLYENPFQRRKFDPAECWSGDRCLIENRNTAAAPVTVLVRGVADRTVRPSVYCAENQQGVCFDGIVPNGRTLLVDEDGGAWLDDTPVDQWVITYRGAAFDDALYDRGQVVTEHGGGVGPYDGVADVPSYQSHAFAPSAPVGRSEWQVHVATGRWDGTEWDYSVFAMPDAPSGVYDADLYLDECVYAVPPNAIVGMAWDERVPCAFKLLLPPRIPPLASSSARKAAPVNYDGRIATLVGRFKGAGVRAYVETALDTWRLGESTLRDSGAKAGEGVEHGATTIYGPRSEMFVPPDRSA